MKFLFFLRSAFGALFLFPVITIVYSMLVILFLLLKFPSSWLNQVVFAWARQTLWMFNVQLKETGTENIPQGGCLFLFNHTSFFDIFVLLAQVENLRFGAKIELFSIPIFGTAMKIAGTLPIVRQNREQSIKVLKDAEDRARAGQKFALAPEGTRNSTEQLMPFKSGPFIFAINAQVPIIPVVIKGALSAWPKNKLIPCANHWKNIISVDYLSPVSVAGFSVEQRAVLSDKVRQLMTDRLHTN